MGAPQYEQAGADIGGSGTTNTIPRWTGASTLGDSGLIDNGTAVYTTTRNVGIGTASPAARVNVDGNAVYNNTATQAFRVSNGSTRVVDIGYDSGLEKAFIQPVQLGTAYRDLLLAPNGGNVGIGTASPGYKLDVAGVINTTDQVRVFSSATSADVRLNAGFGGTVAGLGTVGAQPFMFFTSNTERARIDSSGNFGIGTASPISPLHVKGNATNTDGILTLTPNTGGRNHQVQSLQASSLFRIYDQSAGVSRLEIDINGNISAATTGGTFNASTSGAGLKLPATPGNADTQTLDCYLDGGASGGATWAPVDNSGAGLTFTVTSARYMRIGRLVLASFDITFPVTASAAQAKISLPVTAQAVWQGASIGFGPNVPGLAAAVNNADLNFWTYGAATTNASLSGARLIVSMSYFAN